MRQLFMITLVALATGLTPAMTRAESPNQAAAKQIRNQLHDSGQLSHYKISVSYQNGTVWLQGYVRDQDQFQKAVALVIATHGVTVNQVNYDGLTIKADNQPSASNSTGSSTLAIVRSGANDASNPLRSDAEATGPDYNQAQALPSSFSPTRAARPVAMMQAAAPMPPMPNPPNAAPGPLPAADVTTAVPGGPLPMYAPGTAAGGPAPVRYDHPAMPGYAWPSYASYPNYAAVTYPKQYSPTAWPYIGPFYPYPQVPLGWRKVSLQWDDGWWWLDFKDKPSCCWWR